MKNDLKDIKGLFLVDNKEATVEAIKKIKSVIIYTHGQIKQLHGHEIKDEKNITTLCTAIINNFFWLVNTLDKSKKSELTKDFDWFDFIDINKKSHRDRDFYFEVNDMEKNYNSIIADATEWSDFKDYDFLPGCVQILEEITEGWDRVTFAADKASAFG